MTTRNINPLIITSLAILASLSTNPVKAQTYDAAAQFSATSNPNGVWSYGFDTGTLDSGFSLYGDHVTFANGLQAWDIVAGDNPSVIFNPTASPITLNDTTWPALTLALHPGSAGQFSKLRFTVPTTGLFSIDTSFFGDSTAPATTDVYVLRNGNPLFSSFVNLNGLGNQTNYSAVIAASQNDVIDFAVGRGNATHLSDTTGLRARVTGIPEASTALFGLALLGATLTRQSRKKPNA